ncbi:predicted protein [Chaetomium globosum CBS 148.51]|uniref:Uncharacterized protein n=1 Tax=Chaetomium globosum (strain ATCC 6205 / CBS 148.51 / DSM 1962 / NBRC 6347 / NRRL 1970) TaxID=306901 RepID=Q2HE58_CHAGB|nr:uncharacterized protein CHGG_01496 [Chaetomium globosum CBS 148.51]EAQ93261.1 predicted protein [Chaetomium globosum CBS 148.51]
MHQPPYPPSQAQPMPPDMHPHPHQPPYPAHQMQQLPSMPPPSTQYQETVPMTGPRALQPGQSSADSSQPSPSQSQERAPLTPEQKRQQELNLKPYSSEDDQSRVYS